MKTTKQIIDIVEKRIQATPTQNEFKVHVPFKNDFNYQTDEQDEIAKAVDHFNKKGFVCTYSVTFMEFHLKRK